MTKFFIFIIGVILIILIFSYSHKLKANAQELNIASSTEIISNYKEPKEKTKDEKYLDLEKENKNLNKLLSKYAQKLDTKVCR